MDSLTFTDRMIGHAVWPLVVIGLLWIFRKTISERLSQLRSVSAGPGGVEAQFVESQVAQVINKAAEAMEGETPEVTEEIAEDRDRLLRMASISPRAAVLESFRLVDLALKHHLAQLEIPGAAEDMRSTPAILLAQKHGLVTNTDVAVWNDLRDIANTARQLEGVPIRVDKARDYVGVTSDLRAKIESARPIGRSVDNTTKPDRSALREGPSSPNA